MINENEWNVVSIEIPFPDGEEREVLAQIVHYRPGVPASVFGAPEDSHEGEDEVLEYHLYNKDSGARLNLLEDYIHDNRNLEIFVDEVVLSAIKEAL